MTDHARRTVRATPAPAPHLRELEFEVAREIAETFLTSSSPLEVYRLALARVTPLVGASFASVFLRDECDPELLRLACAQNWPQASARFLADFRIRKGRGPTGRAVLSLRPVEVTDVFADPALRDWWEPARELGITSIYTLPLAVGDRAFGALSFYFARRQRFDDDARVLLGVVAHQLSATAERAQLMADLASSNLELERENEALRREIAAAESTLGRVRREEEAERRGLSDRPGPGSESR